MTTALLLTWRLADDGLLARAEVRFARAALDGHPAAVEAGVEVAAATAQARAAWTGAAVVGGCNRRECSVVVEGLSTTIPAVQAEVEAALSSPSLDCPGRRQLRRDWRFRALAPGPVLDAATLAAVGDPAASLHRTGPPRPGAVARALRAFSTLPAASGRGVEPLGPASPALGVPTSRTWVEFPGGDRAQVVVAWDSTGEGDDLVRDAWLAGDFESRMVQVLREQRGLTYDVEPDAGPGWAAATFDVALADVEAAVGAALDVLSASPEDGEVAGALRRLQARAAALEDTLAGRLTPPPSLPGPAPASLPPAVLRAVVVVGSGEGQGAGWTVVDRCDLLYLGGCPR